MVAKRKFSRWLVCLRRNAKVVAEAGNFLIRNGARPLCAAQGICLQRIEKIKELKNDLS